ncbi:tRNA modification GTPase GTPBP3, mitochondrial [Anopheles funestus]|uniref:tRNA modification GTPase GTPBP3, mitochondrial n=1 Tax=Anopheles funestus TaxID=62324 RepID=UPI0020C664D9|nr:tRNA modification GTPase GTPBP3, mitochondrial [Anopheles funestus]XP_049285227.1 tRNA modification GTPase GTPBP3, mitochondrial [Anopheles funestus]XP_049285228.1 tRNA modification GTPase GTPBP3, mitochondrial [Anopheles funestus]XP_049285230.1 tRNA modification GTPase GTPBP3, mitochondrial [Anopheles funestus]
MLCARLYSVLFSKQLNNLVFRQSCRNNSTIFGISSGFGKCGVAVIRVSGPASQSIIHKKTRLKECPEPRRALLTKIFHGETRAMIDRGLLLWFPGPNSFTGEDTVEFHVHGGSAIVSAMYDSLATFADTRIAEPGEFTKRAFFAGKMDLTEVEGLADLIHAETEAQRRQALRQANGQLSCFYNDMRARLVNAIASIEAYIDFSEDQDVDDDVLHVAVQKIEAVIEELKVHLNDNRRGERLRNGVRAAIVGAPNVGKSSLINLLSQRNVSIVTSIAGTTRDIVESHYDIAGYPVILADTAGLRSSTDDVVESEGIARARTYVECADLLLLVVDASRIESVNRLDAFMEEYIQALGIEQRMMPNTLTILNKCDLVDNVTLQWLKNNSTQFTCLSCESKEGLAELMERMKTRLEQLCGNPAVESPTISQERHRFHLKQCLTYLERFRDYFKETAPQDRDLAIVTHHLRNAVRCIGKITGTVETEEILDVIFSSFCIGK